MNQNNSNQKIKLLQQNNILKDTQPLTIELPQIFNSKKFQNLVNQNQINPKVASQLYKVLTRCKIVILCDDSGTMEQPIFQSGVDIIANQSTRWLQLKKLVCKIIQYYLTTNEQGLDIHFYNRPSLYKVTDEKGLAETFSQKPLGRSPLCKQLRSILSDYSNLPEQKQLLVIVIVDGKPSDGNINDLINIIQNRDQNVHISFVECTDNQKDTQYLDQFDKKLQNCTRTHNYKIQLARIRTQYGPKSKFNYNDYVVKIILSAFEKQQLDFNQLNLQQKEERRPNIFSRQFKEEHQKYRSISFNETVYKNPRPIIVVNKREINQEINIKLQKRCEICCNLF